MRPMMMLRFEVSMRGIIGGMTLPRKVSMDSAVPRGRVEELGG